MIRPGLPVVALSDTACGCLPGAIGKRCGDFARELKSASGPGKAENSPTREKDRVGPERRQPLEEDSMKAKGNSRRRGTEPAKRSMREKHQAATDAPAACGESPGSLKTAGSGAPVQENSSSETACDEAHALPVWSGTEIAAPQDAAERCDPTSRPGTAETTSAEQQLSLKELAFAARVAAAAQAESGTGQEISEGKEPGGSARELRPDAASAGAQPEAALHGLLSQRLQDSCIPANRPGPDKSAMAPERTFLREIQPEMRAPRHGAVREVALQLPGGSDGRTEVRFTERDGELRVSVRTSDAELRQELRANLSDLVGRLGETGYRSETWRPPEVQPRGDTSWHRESFSGGGWGGDSGQKGARQDSDRTAWVEELESKVEPNSTRSVAWLHRYNR